MYCFLVITVKYIRQRASWASHEERWLAPMVLATCLCPCCWGAPPSPLACSHLPLPLRPPSRPTRGSSTAVPILFFSWGFATAAPGPAVEQRKSPLLLQVPYVKPKRGSPSSLLVPHQDHSSHLDLSSLHLENPNISIPSNRDEMLFKVLECKSHFSLLHKHWPTGSILLKLNSYYSQCTVQGGA